MFHLTLLKRCGEGRVWWRPPAPAPRSTCGRRRMRRWDRCRSGAPRI